MRRERTEPRQAPQGEILPITSAGRVVVHCKDGNNVAASGDASGCGSRRLSFMSPPESLAHAARLGCSPRNGAESAPDGLSERLHTGGGISPPTVFEAAICHLRWSL
jgi:hypothetical protein